MSVLCEAEIASAEVLRQLDCILADSRFATAGRNARFLRYVVEKTLAGAASEIKEIVIATDIYCRSTDYDPKVDSIVRVEATRLRSKLSSYYEQQGKDDPILITIPKGTYVPQFERQLSESPVEATVAKPDNCEPSVKSPRWQGPVKLLPSITLLSLCSMAMWLWGHNTGGSFAATVLPSGNPLAAISAEALAAWEEGNALLQGDPHMGSSEHGAPPTLLRAIERYEYTVAQAPSFARGWASLAEAYEYAFAFVGRDPTSDARRAEAAARRAIALDSKLAAGHATLGLVLFYLRWDLAGAEAEYRRALELDSRLPYAVVEYADLLRETGRTSGAESEIRKARAFLPALPVLASKQAEIELDHQQVETAIATATAAIRLKRDYGRAYIVLGMAYEQKGALPEALEQYRAALAMDSQDRRALPALGYLLGRMGRRDEAQSVLRRLMELNSRVRNCAFQIAVVYAGLGEKDCALDWLERAYQTRQMHVPFMTVEYRFSPLRNHERFRAIVRQLGLRMPA